MTLLCIVFEKEIQPAPIIGAAIAAIFVVIGWYIISSLNRRNEIAKKLLDYRLDMLQSVLKISFLILQKQKTTNEALNIDTFQIALCSMMSKVKYKELAIENSDIISLLEEANEKVLLYGRKKEITNWKSIYLKFNEIIKDNKREDKIALVQYSIGEDVKRLVEELRVLNGVIINNIRKELNLSKIKNDN